MPFRVVGRLGQRMRQAVGIGDCPTARDDYGVDVRRHIVSCNQLGVCGRVWHCGVDVAYRG